jgi:ribosome biogenesis GTPase
MRLVELGWDTFFDQHFLQFKSAGLVPARVVREQRELYQVDGDHGELSARISGRLRHTAETRSNFPAVGDWVAIEPRVQEGQATIHAVLPRKSRFSRKVAWRRTEEQVVAANIDTVFLVSDLGRDFNLRRFERYLTVAWESGAKPVLLLNKADLCPDPEPFVEEAQSVAFGVPTHAVSAIRGQGLGAVRDHIGPGRTAALLGSSGVGKSTLINGLLGTEALRVGAVRQDDGRGRHVTTWRELVVIPDGGVIIDTPGMRELQLWTYDRTLESSFEDIAEVAARCRFRDCTHKTEPGCAVRQALEDGTMDADRYKSYAKLKREVAYLAARRGQKERMKQRDHLKQIAKWSRERKRFHPKAM